MIEKMNHQVSESADAFQACKDGSQIEVPLQRNAPVTRCEEI